MRLVCAGDWDRAAAAGPDTGLGRPLIQAAHEHWDLRWAQPDTPEVGDTSPLWPLRDGGLRAAWR